LGNFITGMVNRYKTKVKAWDVINELVDDNGNRNKEQSCSNTTAEQMYWFWSNYLGRDYALKAFNYAKAADPAALLFINDYNLESRAVKLDSLIAMVTELKAKVQKLMVLVHKCIYTQYQLDGIDQMFKNWLQLV
jgi:endo-1,4-beta-xylanase